MTVAAFFAECAAGVQCQMCIDRQKPRSQRWMSCFGSDLWKMIGSCWTEHRSGNTGCNNNQTSWIKRSFLRPLFILQCLILALLLQNLTLI